MTIYNLLLHMTLHSDTSMHNQSFSDMPHMMSFCILIFHDFLQVTRSVSREGIDAAVQKSSQPKSAQPVSGQPASGQSASGRPVVDLTNEDSDNDIQRAIAASLQDNTPGILGGQISREDQDISR